jgi:hypothetical protein
MFLEDKAVRECWGDCDLGYGRTESLREWTHLTTRVVNVTHLSKLAHHSQRWKLQLSPRTS